MANNRLYLIDTGTGARILLAKSFGNGWDVRVTQEHLQSWIDGRDGALVYGNCFDAGQTALVLMDENTIGRFMAAEKKLYE